ncbi:MAG: tetratricopeptide repeat protein [Candidatus Xenobiia bacterium LiM19]
MYRLFIPPLLACLIAFFLFTSIEPLNRFSTVWWAYLCVFGVTGSLMMAYFNNLLSLRVKGKSGEALHHFHLWKYFLPADHYWMSHMEMLLEAEMLEEARLVYASLEKENRLARWVLCQMRFTIARKSKDYNAAENALREALMEDLPAPMRVSLMGDLAMLFVEFKPDRIEEAQRLLEDAIQDEDSKTIRPFLEGLLSCSLVVEGKYEKAAEEIQSSISRLRQIAKGNALANVYLSKMYRYLGKAYEALDRKEEARSAFQTGLTLTGIEEVRKELEEDIRKL